MFTSKAMRVFMALYQEGSLKKAAEKMNLTVPPVSRMLKMTEEWVGESLFGVERNRIVPTQAARRIYNQLLPHYYALNSILKNQSGSSLQIASPQSFSSIISDLLLPIIPLLEIPFTINDMESIHDDHEIFISFDKVNAPTFFEVTRIEILSSLICPIKFSQAWQNKNLLTEKAITHQPGFQKALAVLRVHGFTGNLQQVDNAACLNHNFNNGDGLMFKLITTTQNEYHILPVIYHQPLYIYTNGFKKNSKHDALISHIRNTADLRM